MPQFLPPNLLALFSPRDPIPYLPPVNPLSWDKKTDGYSGIGDLMKRFEDPKDTPPIVVVETKDERITRKKKEKAEQIQYKLEQEIALWDPTANQTANTDPYKTLFIARLNYDSSESKLRREFEGYGPIKQIIMVHNSNNGKPRGYAFIEYEHERDMHSAYKHADGKKIDNKRILVDVERARTVAGWLPRRLGGGLGGTRLGGEDMNVRISGRENDRQRTDERILREERDRDNDRRGGGRDRETDRRSGGGAAAAAGGDRDRSRRDDRGDRRRRSRSRDRKRRRSASTEAPPRRRRRSRERNGNEEEERRPHRSDRNGQDDEERKRKDHKRRSRDRSRERRRKDKERARDPENSVKIKQEPQDDYPDFVQPPLLPDANFAMKEEENE